MSVVLANSGGLDSALIAAWLKDQGEIVHSVFIDFKCINTIPAGIAAEKTADLYCASHRTINLDFGYTPNHWKIDGVIYPYDDFKDRFTVHDGYLRAASSQGFIAYSLCISYAAMVGANKIYSGNKGVVPADFGYKMNDLLTSNTMLADQAPEVLFPLLDRPTYYDEAAASFGLNVLDFGYTHSCTWAEPCGVCSKCVERKRVGLDV